MRKGSIVALSVAAGVVIGCAVASSPLIVPPVRAGTTPQKWEYLCFERHWKKVHGEANKVGKHGWEMVGLSGTTGILACFKRPLP